MSLTTLPLLVLYEIASKLDFSSLVNLATSTTDLAHLQPKEQQVSGEDFSIHEEYSDGHFCPKTYFDVEVVTRGLVGVKMAWEWKDQGWGNQKGQVWLQLVRSNQVVEDNREEYFALAPHTYRSFRVFCDQIRHQIWRVTEFSDVFCDACGDNFGVSPNLVTFCASFFVRFLVNHHMW